jgi:hypothetical protein
MPPAAMAVRVEGIAYAFAGVKPLKLPQRGAAPPSSATSIVRRKTP